MSDDDKLTRKGEDSYTPESNPPYRYTKSNKLFTSVRITTGQRAILEAFMLLATLKITGNQESIPLEDICLMLATKHKLDCQGCKDQRCPRWLDQFR